MRGERLEDAVAIVTGGAGGLGAAVVRRIVEEGGTAIVAGRDVQRGQTIASEISERKASFIQLDVTDEHGWSSAIDNVIAEYGRIDVLVNNAAIAPFETILQSSVEAFRNVMEVNATGTWLGMRAVLPFMVGAGKGAIVNVSSLDGHRGMPAQSAYVASKAAVIGMTRVAALEVAASGVRVNSVSPGGILTPLAQEGAFDALGVDLSHLAGSVPMQRFADPAEIASLIVYLASPDASYLTGTDFLADGGWSATYQISLG